MVDTEQTVRKLLDDKLKPEEGNSLILERLDLGATKRDWRVMEDYLLSIDIWNIPGKKEVVSNIFEYLDNEGLRVRHSINWGPILLAIGVTLATISLIVLKAVT